MDPQCEHGTDLGKLFQDGFAKRAAISARQNKEIEAEKTGQKREGKEESSGRDGQQGGGNEGGRQK